MKFIDRIRAFLWSDLPPWKMGFSAAIGIFIAVTPTVGLQTVLVLAVVSLVRGNRGIALVASGIANPWTMPLIYYVDFKVGALLTGDPAWAGLPERFTMGALGGTFIQVLIGSLVIGGVLAAVVGAVVAALCRFRRASAEEDGCRYEAAR